MAAHAADAKRPEREFIDDGGTHRHGAVGGHDLHRHARQKPEMRSQMGGHRHLGRAGIEQESHLLTVDRAGRDIVAETVALQDEFGATGLDDEVAVGIVAPVEDILEGQP